MTDTPQQTLFTMNALPFIYMAQAKGLTNNEGVMQTLTLATQDGKIKVSLDPQLLYQSRGGFPFQADDGILVMLSLVKASAHVVPDTPGGGILMPDKRIVRPQ